MKKKPVWSRLSVTGECDPQSAGRSYLMAVNKHNELNCLTTVAFNEQLRAFHHIREKNLLLKLLLYYFILTEITFNNYLLQLNNAIYNRVNDK